MNSQTCSKGEAILHSHVQSKERECVMRKTERESVQWKERKRKRDEEPTSESKRGSKIDKMEWRMRLVRVYIHTLHDSQVPCTQV